MINFDLHKMRQTANINYKRIHPHFGVFEGAAAAKMALLKASFIPSPDLAEVSQYAKALILFDKA